MSLHSVGVRARGFSQSTCLPDCSAWTHIVAWSVGGVDTRMTSTSLRATRACQLRSTAAPCREARERALSSTRSLTAVKRNGPACATARARICPMSPQPIRPNRKGDWVFIAIPLDENAKDSSLRWQPRVCLVRWFFSYLPWLGHRCDQVPSRAFQGGLLHQPIARQFEGLVQMDTRRILGQGHDFRDVGYASLHVL